MILQSVTYIRNVFENCHLTFPYEEILSLFGLCHVKFRYVGALFFWWVCKKVLVFFSNSIDQKTPQQSDGSCNVTNDSHVPYKLFKKLSFFSYIYIIETHMKKGL